MLRVNCSRGKDYSHQKEEGDNLGEIAMDIMRNDQNQDICLKVEPTVFPDRLDKAQERKKRSEPMVPPGFGPGQ